MQHVGPQQHILTSPQAAGIHMHHMLEEVGTAPHPVAAIVSSRNLITSTMDLDEWAHGRV